MKHLLYTTFLLLLSSTLSAQQVVNAGANINTKKSTDGISKFDRSIFINLHSSYNGNDWTEKELQQVSETLGANFGRSVGGTTWQMNRVRENAERQGFFDLEHMKTLGAESRGWYANKSFLRQFEPQNTVLTSHISPTFPNGTQTNQGFAPDGYEAVAQFYAYFLKEYYGQNGKPKPAFLEVMNEPFVHANELKTTNAEISKFHAVVADSVHAHHDDVMVGGYTAAWPEFERNNFGIWDDTWRTFIDIAGEKMDFFSVHLYDVPKAEGHAIRRGSNTEAILDMIEQYSWLKLGEVKPFVISEYGSCCADWDGPYTEERDWLILQSFTSLTMSLMDRPNKILKAIPFIVDKAVWYLNNNPYQYPHVLLENRNGGSEWEYTHLVKYYQMLSAIDGERVDTWSNDPDLQVDAYVDQNKAYVLFANLEDIPVKINFKATDINNNSIVDIRVKHLFAANDIPQLEEKLLLSEPNFYQLDANGSMVIEYTFQENIELSQKLEEIKHYADRYWQNIQANTPITFIIDNITPPSFGNSILRLGIGRSHGESLKPTVTLNGTNLEVSDDWMGYDQRPRDRFFGLIEVEVPNALLQSNNKVVVTFSDDGGHVSTAIMQVRNYDHSPQMVVSTNDPLPAWAQEIVIYPNPARNLVTVDHLAPKRVSQIRLFDTNGKLILQKVVDRTSLSLNINQLP
ncbi:MAG: T9SS type A sorting domain-containing protein, partial [Bacteroidota bacterium]